MGSLTKMEMNIIFCPGKSFILSIQYSPKELTTVPLKPVHIKVKLLHAFITSLFVYIARRCCVVVVFTFLTLASSSYV